MMKLTNKELEVLTFIWKNGPSTVRAVHEHLQESSNAGYTSTLKMMQLMFEKGMLGRVKSGKTHIYRSEVNEELAQSELLGKLLNTAFHGSASQLVMQLLGTSKSTPEEINEIRAFLDSMEEE